MEAQLDSIFQKLDVLGSVKPGYIVSVDDHRWVHVDHRAWQTWDRLVKFLQTWKIPDKRRDAFAAAFKQEIAKLNDIYDLKWERAVVQACCDEKGQLSRQKVESKTGKVDVETLSMTLEFLHRIYRHGCRALHGLQVLQSSPPYNDDSRFESEVTIQLVEPLRRLLAKVVRRAGDYATHIQMEGVVSQPIPIPILSTPHPASTSTATTSSATTPATPVTPLFAHISNGPSQSLLQSTPTLMPQPLQSKPHTVTDATTSTQLDEKTDIPPLNLKGD